MGLRAAAHRAWERERRSWTKSPGGWKFYLFMPCVFLLQGLGAWLRDDGWFSLFCAVAATLGASLTVLAYRGTHSPGGSRRYPPQMKRVGVGPTAIRLYWAGLAFCLLAVLATLTNQPTAAWAFPVGIGVGLLAATALMNGQVGSLER